MLYRVSLRVATRCVFSSLLFEVLNYQWRISKDGPKNKHLGINVEGLLQFMQYFYILFIDKSKMFTTDQFDSGIFIVEDSSFKMNIDYAKLK